MRHRTLAGIVAVAALALVGCARQRLEMDARAGTGSLGDCHVFVVNKSSEETISAVVYVDDEEVLRGDYPHFSRVTDSGGVWLQLPLGVHRVRAVVGSETTEIEVTVSAHQPCECQIILYDEPDEFAPGRFSRLSVQQIYPC